MKLSPAQLTQYNERGFVVLPHFFTDQEVAAMRAELERFKRAGLLRNVATEGDGVTTSTSVANLQICPLMPQSTLFRALSFEAKVLEVVRQCIGDPVQHQLDQIFLKPGKHGAGTSWHQDNAYFSLADPTQGVGMWIALHDATIANGTMHVIPGIYRSKLEHTRDGGSNHHIRCYPNEDQAVAVEIEAGGALLFNYGVPHCTKPNTTDHERAGLALHFVRADASNRSPKPSSGPLLTGPGASDGTAEWGVKVSGTWQQEVSRALAASA